MRSEDEAVIYDVEMGSNDCWRGKLAERRDTTARAIPVQAEIGPRRDLDSLRGCL